MKNSFPKIPYEVVMGIINNNEDALKYVLDVFKPYIIALSTTGKYDCLGHYSYKTDEDLVAYIQSRLALKLSDSFKILPDND